MRLALEIQMKPCNDLVFQNDRLLFIQSAEVHLRLCLNVELSIPQTLNNELVALGALVDVLDIICRVLASFSSFCGFINSPVVVSKWLVAS
jgi:hypothetical protein